MGMAMDTVWLRGKVKSIILTVAVAGLALVLWGCEQKPPQGQQGGAPPVAVSMAEVKTGPAPITIAAIGNAKAFTTIAIKSRVTGHLQKIHFASGQTVQAGQLLFSIDQTPFQLSANEAQAILDQNKAQVEQSKRDFERYKKLRKKGAVSPEDYESKETTYLQARDAVAANQAKLAIAKQDLIYCRIHAPIGGVAGKRLIDAGNLIQANSDTLVTINQIEPMIVRFAVPGDRLDEIRGKCSQGKLTVKVAPPGGWDKAIIGHLSFVDNQINQETGMINLEAKFDNADHCLWPGQFLEVRLILSVEEKAILVPFTAVLDSQQGYFVWRVKADQTVEIKPIKRARREGEYIVVSEGVKAGDKVVVDGQLRLRPGAKIFPAKSPDQKKSGGKG